MLIINFMEKLLCNQVFVFLSNLFLKSGTIIMPVVMTVVDIMGNC